MIWRNVAFSQVVLVALELINLKKRLGPFHIPLPHAGQYNIKIMLKLVNLFESIQNNAGDSNYPSNHPKLGPSFILQNKKTK